MNFLLASCHIHIEQIILMNLEGQTALHLSVVHPPVVRLLLSRNADFKVKNKKGMTALHCAASRGSIPVITMLLNKRAHIEAVDDDGNSRLVF